MTRPTREQLAALMWSDEATAEWEADAHQGVTSAHAKGPIVDRVHETFWAVGAELDEATDDLGDGPDGDAGSLDEREALLDLAATAKRGAILLLHAAFAAENAAKR